MMNHKTSYTNCYQLSDSCTGITCPGWDFIWQSGSAADRNILEVNRYIGRKSRVFVAFWIGIRKSIILDRNKSFQEQKTNKTSQQKYFQDLSILIF